MPDYLQMSSVFSWIPTWNSGHNAKVVRNFQSERCRSFKLLLKLSGCPHCRLKSSVCQPALGLGFTFEVGIPKRRRTQANKTMEFGVFLLCTTSAPPREDHVVPARENDQVLIGSVD